MLITCCKRSISRQGLSSKKRHNPKILSLLKNLQVLSDQVNFLGTASTHEVNTAIHFRLHMVTRPYENEVTSKEYN